jgi:glycosyltransferase involved in cell wall biosynthesis
MRIYVVIPGHNEEKYIRTVLKKVRRFTKNVIFIDDGSTDKTRKRVGKLATLVHHETNLGKGAAMLTGASFAFDSLGADAVVFMDADDQHDPSHLPQFFKALKTHQVVYGVRTLDGNVPLLRFVGNKTASIMLNLLYGTYVADIPSGYKAMKREAFTKIRWKSSGYEVETEIAIRVAHAKLSFAVIPIKAIYHERDKGMTLWDAAQILRCLITWRFFL